jgi:hypothetical protein
MFRATVFSSLAALAFAGETLDTLVTAAGSFSAAIERQLEMLQSDPSPTRVLISLRRVFLKGEPQVGQQPAAASK